MPELLEIEMYRRGAASLVGRTIESIDTPDSWYLKGVDATTLADATVGARIGALGRVGKLLVVMTDGPTLGLRFGMTGRLVVDGAPVIDELEYSSKRLDPAWNRFGATFTDGGTVSMNDPRRLGGVELDPDLSRLGPDAWEVTVDEMKSLFGRSRIAVKALLLNQKRIAGLGNLLVDELLWRSGVAPGRHANEVADDAVERLWRALGPMLDELYVRGGSNCGDLFVERSAEGHCPRDGAPLTHDSIGGRSTWWCAVHQH